MTRSPSDLNLPALRAAALAATPGEWFVAGDVCVGVPVCRGYSGQVADCEGSWSDEQQSKANAHFIAAANPAVVLGLLDELAELRKTRGEATHLALNMRDTARWERDRERAVTVAWLRAIGGFHSALRDPSDLADAIERGDHLTATAIPTLPKEPTL